MTVVEDDAAAINASLNDPAAFRAVFDRHFDAVHRFVRRRVGSAFADDIAAETFVRAFEHRARYRPERHRDGVDARMDAEAARRRLAEAFAELRTEERDVLLLFAWAELDYAEIADALDVPIGTVRSRLSRGREHVRTALATKPEPEVTGERA